MNWTTLYIQGKSKFGADVLRNLENSGFNFLHGHSLESGVCLYWIEEKAALRDFKLAIGSKVIFKHRLRFYASVEELIESQSKPNTGTYVSKLEPRALKSLS